MKYDVHRAPMQQQFQCTSTVQRSCKKIYAIKKQFNIKNKNCFSNSVLQDAKMELFQIQFLSIWFFNYTKFLYNQSMNYVQLFKLCILNSLVALDWLIILNVY